MGYVFTFGFGHVSPVDGSPLASYYVEAPDPLDELEARSWCVLRFGRFWSSQYDTVESAGVEEYRLRRAEIPDPVAIPDLEVRIALGERYWEARHWRDVAASARQALLAGRAPIEVAEQLYRGEMG